MEPQLDVPAVVAVIKREKASNDMINNFFISVPPNTK